MCIGNTARRKRQTQQGVEFTTDAVFSVNDTSTSAQLANTVTGVLNTPGLLSDLGANVGIDPNTIVTEG